jgi:MerR family transcriptional regulator/heat shock protein HspR
MTSTPGSTPWDRPVYVISVAAELAGLHPQTLRNYDRIGLVSPGRAGGGGRRYSPRDIALLQEIQELTAAGIGMAGVRRILDLENQVTALHQRVSELMDELTAAHRAIADAMTPNLPEVRRPATLIPYHRQVRRSPKG